MPKAARPRDQIAEAVGLEPTSGAWPPPVFKTGSSSSRMTSDHFCVLSARGHVLTQEFFVDLRQVLIRNPHDAQESFGCNRHGQVRNSEQPDTVGKLDNHSSLSVLSLEVCGMHFKEVVHQMISPFERIRKHVDGDSNDPHLNPLEASPLHWHYSQLEKSTVRPLNRLNLRANLAEEPIVLRTRGDGFEPPQPGSKPGGLPLADPRICWTRQRNRLSERFFSFYEVTKGSLSCGGRNRTCVGALNRRLPVPARAPPQSESAQLDSNQRSPAPEAGGLPGYPIRRWIKAPSGSRTRTSAMARQQAAATSWVRFSTDRIVKEPRAPGGTRTHVAALRVRSPRR